MRKLLAFTVLAALLMPAAAPAQTFEKKNYTYSEWTKGRFSEAVTLIGPGKMIFLAGVGSEDENGKGGDILHKGDFTAQCKYAFEKIKRALDKNGATLGDIVKMVTYLTDVRYQPDFGKCRQDTFGTTPMPAATSKWRRTPFPGSEPNGDLEMHFLTRSAASSRAKAGGR